MKEEAKLALQLFGAPVLHCDDTPMPLSRRKAMALLSYLAVTRSRHHRETLAALLWPESDSTAAYSALRNVLWILRQTPLDEAVLSDRSTVELVESEMLEVDVNKFRDLTACCPNGSHVSTEACAECEPLLREAVRLWGGSFMSGFTVTNSVRFDDWQFAEGEALRRELTETLDRMIEYYFSIEDWAAAARYARQWLQVDALNELGYRKLMQALAARGARSEALQTFEECTRVLTAELGLSPEESTTELAEKIRTSQSTVPSSVKSRSHRLPHALVPMIGRREVSAQLESLLGEESTRVVTLVGLGGSGKTSLALHVGRRIEDQYEHGALFIPLDSITGKDVVVSTVAQALGISLPREKSSALIEQLADFLRDRNLLLILDGAERVLSQVSSLMPALTSADRVQILLTSRIALGTASEVAITLHGLDYPEANVPLERIADYAAVRLLRIAAQRHGNPPDSDTSELAGMARLTRLLEGSPLGLEMAAGWRSMLTWDEIANRVSDNLEFLVHMREDISPRHRAFAAVFEQAWGLLPEEAQAALRRLSAFRNAFTIKAAEYVTESFPTNLALLVNRCLIKRIGPERYEIHELLRQFSSGKLSAAGSDQERVRARHAEFYMRSVAKWFQKLTGPEQYPTLERMGQEIGNVRSAFQHAAEIGASELLHEACEGLFFYYDMRTQFEEAAEVFLNAANAYGKHTNRDTSVDAFLRIASGWFISHARPDLAEERMSVGLKLLVEGLPEKRLHAIANVICAYASAGEDLEGHIQRVRSSVEFYRDSPISWGEGLALAAWAYLESYRDGAQAESLAYQSLRSHREAGDAWGEGLALLALARMAEFSGNLELALTRYEESQRLSEPIAADIVGVIDAIAGQARVTGKLGNGERSAQLAEQALQFSRGIGSRLQTGRSLIELASARRLLGDRTSARQLLEESFALLSHRQWSSLQAHCARILLELALEEADVGAAERWLQEASMLEPESADLLPLSEKLNQLREDCEE